MVRGEIYCILETNKQTRQQIFVLSVRGLSAKTTLSRSAAINHVNFDPTKADRSRYYNDQSAQEEAGGYTRAAASYIILYYSTWL